MNRTMTFGRAVLRGLVGFPLGVFIAYTITIAISLAGRGWGGGWYSPVAPGLAQALGSQLGAVVAQYLLSGLLGFAFAAGSCVWQIESWNYTRQTLVHFALVAGSMLLTAYVCHWFAHTWLAFAGFLGIFAVIYAVVWVCCYLAWEHKTRAIQEALKKKRAS